MYAVGRGFGCLLVKPIWRLVICVHVSDCNDKLCFVFSGSAFWHAQDVIATLHVQDVIDAGRLPMVLWYGQLTRSVASRVTKWTVANNLSSPMCVR